MELQADKIFEREEWLSSLPLVNVRVIHEREEEELRANEQEEIQLEKRKREKRKTAAHIASEYYTSNAETAKSAAKEARDERMAGVLLRRRKRLEKESDEIEAALVEGGYAKKKVEDGTPLLEQEEKGFCSCCLIN